MHHAQRPSVYLVGAGPGSPDLITLRGVELLRRADCVIYDYLVDPALLNYVPSTCERVCLGRHGGREFSQDEIHRMMIDAARRCRTVVRLKGGDPTIFGRAFEETAALTAAGVAYEIVPAATAATAAAAYAEIPLTHGEISSAVAFVTGHLRGEKRVAPLDYAKLAEFPGALVFYMGVRSARVWSEALLGAGRPADEPVALVRRCAMPDQSLVRCTLGELADVVERKKIQSPAVVIVGAAVELAPIASWYSSRPLFGQCVLVTRPQGADDALGSAFRELGAETLLQPAIAISDPPDWAPVDDVIRRLGEFDWVVFSSANGVRYFLERIYEQGADLRRFNGAKIAAIGPGTADKLAEYRLRADLVPPQFVAESLADALAVDAKGKRLLLIRASRGRDVLPDKLNAAGALIEQVVAYSSDDVDSPEPEIASRLALGQIEWVTVTSSSVARSLVRLFGESLRRAKLASLSPVTSAALRELGFEPTVEAASYTFADLAAAIRDFDYAD